MNVKAQCQRCSAAIENWDNTACNSKKNCKGIFVSESNHLCLYLPEVWKSTCCFSHNLLLDTLASYRQDGWSVQWIRIQVMCHTQRMVISGFYSGWQSVTNGSPREHLHNSSEIMWRTALKAASPSLLMRKLGVRWTHQKGETSHRDLGRLGEQELDEV